MRTICLGLVVSTVSVGLGAAFAHALALVGLDTLHEAAFSIMVTYLLAIGSVLVLTELPKSWGANSEGADDAQAQRNPAIREYARTHLLTERETDILFELLTNESIPNIATKLCISGNTLNSHVKKVYQKTGVHGRDKLRKAVEDWLS